MGYIILAQFQYASTQSASTILKTLEDRNSIRSAVVKTTQHALRRTRPHIWVPPTPFSGYLGRNRYPVSHEVYSAWGQQYTDTVQGWINFPVRNAALLTSLRNTAVIRALQNLKDQDINCSQAIAEAGQVGRLVASSATRLANAIRSVKRGDIKGVQKALGLAKAPQGKAQHLLDRIGRGIYKGAVSNSGAVADTWLELQYGWKPLLSDVHGMATTLAKNDIADPNRYRYTVRGTAEDKTDAYVESISGTLRQYTRRRISHSVRVNLTYNSTNVNTALAANVGASNPLNLAWELLPFSFVADWFIPIGDYLQCLDATLGYNFLGGCYTTRWTVDLEHDRTIRNGYTDRWVAFDPYQSQGSNFYCHGGSNSTKQIERFVYGASPFPRFPGFKNPLSLTHAANAIALLRGTVR